MLGVKKIRPFERDRGIVAVSLLRRHYFEMDSEIPVIDVKYIDVTLNEFKDTVAIIGREKFNFREISDELRFSLDIEGDGTIYGFPRDIIENIVAENSGYIIVKSLFFRLSIAHRMMRWCIQNDDRRNAFRWQLFIDTHIDLVLYIVTEQQYEDDLLQDPTKNLYDPLQSAYTVYYPSDTRCFYCGDLPDLTDCIDMGNTWFDIRPKTNESLISAIIHIIGSKTQDHKCQVRNFGKILYEYYKSFPVLAKLLVLFTRVSLLGNYPFCRCRPSFSARLVIVRDMQIVSADDNRLFRWIYENEQFMCYLSKEFNVYLVEMQYSFDLMLLNTTSWESIKKSTITMMDYVRSRLNSIDNRGILADFEREMKIIHKKNLANVSKLRKSHFVNVISVECNKFHEKNVVDSSSERIQSSDIHFERSFLLKMNSATRHVASRPDHFVETRWLKCFGISEYGYNAVRSLYFEYETMELADNAISSRIRMIYDNNARDFHLLHVYFQQIRQFSSLKTFRLSEDYAENHIEVLRYKYLLLPHEPLPPDAGIFSYCPSCFQWAHPVIDDVKSRTYIHVYSHHYHNILYDRKTKKLHCGRHVISSQFRRVINNFKNDPSSRTTKTAKMIRRCRENNNCLDTELVRVDMIGKVHKMNGHLWAMCEICGTLTTFDGCKFNGNGFTCILHRSRKPPLPPSSPIVTATDTACVYCGKPVKSNDSFLVINEQYHYEKVTLCDVHSKAYDNFSAIPRRDLLKKSELIAEISAYVTRRTTFVSKKTRGKYR